MEFDGIEERIGVGRQVVKMILEARKLSFHDLTPTKLPEEPGLYVISSHDGAVIRAGRTDKQTLRDRVYRNHLMGNQKGNLRSQLVKNEVSADLETAKQWIRENCEVQVLPKIALDRIGIDIRWAEHFLLAVLRPRFSN